MLSMTKEMLYIRFQTTFNENLKWPKKIVYISKVSCECWSLRRNKYTADAVTYIVEKRRLWHTSYEIKQVITAIKSGKDVREIQNIISA